MSLVIQQRMLQAAAQGGGFGFGPDIWGDDIITDTRPRTVGDDVSNIPWWVSGAPVFGVIGKTLSNIFAPPSSTIAQAGGQARYLPTGQQQQYAVAPPGQHYDSSGRLVADSVFNVTSFIGENPILVAVAVGGVILLFLKPPGRR